MSELVSAIITTHNRKELLIQSIESVLGQTYQNLECIVVDDASDDGTEAFLKNYIDEDKIRYIYIPKDESRGGNHARNIGVKNARGSLLAFLDDDDEWLHQKIEKQVAVLQGNEDIGFVYCGIITEKNMDTSTRKYQPIEDKRYKDGDISREILIRIITTTTTIMIRKSILEEAGLFDENLKYWQEYELCIRVLQKTNAKCVRENLVLYRILEGDKNRLSNKITGWEESVSYIEQKHQNLIRTLTEEENSLRQVYICIDGFLRGKKAGSLQYMFKYAWKALSNRKRRSIVVNKYIKRNRL